MSASHIGKPLPDETKKKISATLTGRKLSKESIELGASKRRGEKHFHFGKPRTMEEKTKTSESLKFFYMTEEGQRVRKKLSEIRKRLGKTPEEKRQYQIRYNRDKRTKLRKMVYELKSCGCEICGEKHPACLDWHHKNQEDKKDVVARVQSMGMKKAIFFLEEESKKCSILCSNCHRKLHHENGTRGKKTRKNLTQGV